MIPDPEKLKNKGVQFLATGNHYSYAAVNLATGLDQLGIPVKGTLGYHSPVHSDFIFRQDVVDPDVALRIIDIVDGGFDYKNPFETDYSRDDTAILNMTDDADAFLYYGDLRVFRAHSTLDLVYPYHYEPIGFGISDFLRKLASLSLGKPNRNPVFIRNFRGGMNQGIRQVLDASLLPLLDVFHNVAKGENIRETRPAEYFDSLSNALGCLVYGGNFMHKLDERDLMLKAGLAPDNAQQLLDCKYKKEVVVIRWDSIQFWDSLATGCLPIHLDFRKYGFHLPKMPTSWEHYIGVDLDNIQGTIERMEAEWNRLPEIAQAGKEWALEHYTPIPTAKRFLEKMECPLDSP